MLEPSKLPAGIHVERDHDAGTFDLVNHSPRPVDACSGELEAAFVRVRPGERLTFVAGESLDCTIHTTSEPRCPPR